jgi:hypothetical protein
LLYLSFAIVWVGAAATVFDFPRIRNAVMQLRPSPVFSVVILAAVLAWWVARLIGGF